MFRTLVIGVTFTLFLAMGLWGATLQSQATLQSAEALAERELSMASTLLPSLYRLDMEAVQAKASELAQSAPLLKALSRPTKSPLSFVQRHEEVDDILKEMKKSEREGSTDPTVQASLGDWAQGHPYFIFAMDEVGVCVAHTNNPRCYAEDEAGTEYTRMAELFPSLKPLIAEGPEGVKGLIDIWVVDHKPMLVGASVVRRETPARRGRGALEEELGVLVVGYPLSALAGHYKERLKLDVAFAREGSIVGGSSLDGALEAHLQALMSETPQTGAGSKATPTLLKTQVGALGALPSSGELTFVVAVDWATREGALGSTSELLLFAILAGLLSLVVVTVAFNRFIEPFKQIDLGLIEVQNGNQDYWFSYNIQDNGLSKTIAQNLDVVVSRLFGRPEPEFEDEP